MLPELRQDEGRGRQKSPKGKGRGGNVHSRGRNRGVPAVRDRGPVDTSVPRMRMFGKLYGWLLNQPPHSRTQRKLNVAPTKINSYFQHGEIDCWPISCPPLSCPGLSLARQPFLHLSAPAPSGHSASRCCPTCPELEPPKYAALTVPAGDCDPKKGQCQFEGNTYRNGDSFRPSQGTHVNCTSCQCKVSFPAIGG